MNLPLVTMNPPLVIMNPPLVTMNPPPLQVRGLLDECVRMLERLQKMLVTNFGARRASFTRFFFLSDEELLNVMSTVAFKDLQHYLCKLFSDVSELEFNTDNDMNTSVCRMHSRGSLGNQDAGDEVTGNKIGIHP